MLVNPIAEMYEYLRNNPEDSVARMAYADMLEEDGSDASAYLAARQRRIAAQVTPQGTRIITVEMSHWRDGIRIYRWFTLDVRREPDGLLVWTSGNVSGLATGKATASRLGRKYAREHGIEFRHGVMYGDECP